MDEQEAKQEVLKFAAALKNAGIRVVTVSYSGCGDEGHAEPPQFESADGTPIEPASLLGELDQDALGDGLAVFVPEGYEDGDGGWGTVTFDVELGKIRVEHNWYETVSHSDEPREI
jgi:hypothetical protein